MAKHAYTAQETLARMVKLKIAIGEGLEDVLVVCQSLNVPVTEAPSKSSRVKSHHSPLSNEGNAAIRQVFLLQQLCQREHIHDSFSRDVKFTRVSVEDNIFNHPARIDKQ